MVSLYNMLLPLFTYIKKTYLLNLDENVEDDNKTLFLLNFLFGEYKHLTITLLYGKGKWTLCCAYCFTKL